MFATIMVAVLALLLASQAFAGPARMARLRARIVGNRSRFYWRLMAGWWALAAIAAVIVVDDGRLTSVNVGLTRPRTGYAGIEPAAAAAAFAWIVTGCLLLLVLAGGIKARRSTLAGNPIPGRDSIEMLLPATPAERRLAAGVSVTAGITEELVFRGLLIAAGVEIYHLPVVAAAAISLVLFAGGHAYQGKRGVIGTAAVGLALTLLFLVSGSLIPGIIVHTAQDLIAFLLVPRAAKAKATAQETPAEATKTASPEASAEESNDAIPEASAKESKDAIPEASADETTMVSPEAHSQARGELSGGEDAEPTAQITLRAPTPRG